MDRPIEAHVLRKEKKRRWIKGLLISAAVIVVLLVLRTWISPSLSAARIRTAVVERGPVEATVTASGVVLPQFEQTISCPFNARVLRVLEQPGAHLAAGQPIAILDATEARADVDRVSDQIKLKNNQREQLQIALDRSERDLATREEILALQVQNFQAKRNMEQALYEKKITTVLSLRQAQLDYQIAQLQYEQAKGDLAQHQQEMKSQIEGLGIEIRLLAGDLAARQERLARATLRAEQSDILTWINLQEGEAVREGEALARIADLSSWRVECTISDIHAARLQPGMPAKIRLDSLTLAGTVSRINPTSLNGAMTLTIALDDPRDARLRSNQKLDVYLVTDDKPDALRLKVGPFTEGAGLQPVFVIQRGTARRVEADLGISNMDYIEVISGLKRGDRVIISDMADYKHMQKIRITGTLPPSSGILTLQIGKGL